MFGRYWSSRCAILRDEDCKRSGGCANMGQCTLIKVVDTMPGLSKAVRDKALREKNPPMVCGAASDADCKVVCKQYGGCKAQFGRCLPSSDAHCKKSLACRKHGRCRLKDRQCEK